jgi:hypothetical protein
MAQGNRSPVNRSPIILVGLIIAAIYVIMLVGLTRSSYFIGGAAFERPVQASGYELATSRSVPAPVPSQPACAAPEAKVAPSPEPADAAWCRALGARTP